MGAVTHLFHILTLLLFIMAVCVGCQAVKPAGNIMNNHYKKCQKYKDKMDNLSSGMKLGKGAPAPYPAIEARQHPLAGPSMSSGQAAPPAAPHSALQPNDAMELDSPAEMADQPPPLVSARPRNPVLREMLI